MITAPILLPRISVLTGTMGLIIVPISVKLFQAEKADTHIYMYNFLFLQTKGKHSKEDEKDVVGVREG